MKPIQSFIILVLVLIFVVLMIRLTDRPASPDAARAHSADSLVNHAPGRCLIS